MAIPGVVESTSAGVTTNMVENPLAELLEVLGIAEPSLLLWLSAAELETAMEGQPLSKKVYLRRTFFTYIDAEGPNSQAASLSRRPANTVHPQQVTSSAATVQVYPQGVPQAPLMQGQQHPSINDITNVAYWCDLSHNYDKEKALDTTKAINAVSHIKCPDNKQYKGNSDNRSINYFLSLIRCEAKQTALGPRLSYIYLSNCLSQSVKRNLQIHLETTMDPTLYLNDYVLTLSQALGYLQHKYSLSNSHAEVMRYFSDVKMDN
ncbi:hypothetical protein Pmar_PMAR010030, partial [Perkinsus marinus ATCC 50983]